jgi:YidC/Oxa1 family membrane protein insertase
MFTTLFYEPLYNALIYLLGIVSGNLGFAIIILTVLVKLLLMPFTVRALKSQALLKKIQPEIDAIRTKIKDKSAQGIEMMSLYKKHKINPFAGCLSLIPQIVILIALYQVFYKGIDLKPDHLYTIVNYPKDVVYTFLSFDLTQKKVLILSIFAGISQFLQVYLSNPDVVKAVFTKKVDEVATNTTNKENEKEFDFATELGKSMQVQMVFILPIMIGFFSYTLPAAMALYWIVSSIATIAQEAYIRKTVS